MVAVPGALAGNTISGCAPGRRDSHGAGSTASAGFIRLDGNDSRNPHSLLHFHWLRHHPGLSCFSPPQVVFPVYRGRFRHGCLRDKHVRIYIDFPVVLDCARLDHLLHSYCIWNVSGECVQTACKAWAIMDWPCRSAPDPGAWTPGYGGMAVLSHSLRSSKDWIQDGEIFSWDWIHCPGPSLRRRIDHPSLPHGKNECIRPSPCCMQAGPSEERMA